MKTVTIKNSKLTSMMFWKSLNALARIEGFDGETTMSIFRLKKLLGDEVDVIRDSVHGADKKTVAEVLDVDYKFAMDFALDQDILADKLTAEDLYQLQPLFL